MATKNNQATITEHHRKNFSAERVEGGTRYTLHDVTPGYGAGQTFEEAIVEDARATAQAARSVIGRLFNRGGKQD